MSLRAKETIECQMTRAYGVWPGGEPALQLGFGRGWNVAPLYSKRDVLCERAVQWCCTESEAVHLHVDTNLQDTEHFCP